MITNECKTIRRQIDETDQLSSEAGAHLSACVECRTFRSDRQALQGLMADLGSIEAPSDFYFRLRARLARNDEGSVGNWGKRSFSFVGRAMAVGALVAVLAVAGVVVKNYLNSPNRGTTVSSKTSQEKGPGQGTEAPQETTKPTSEKDPVSGSLAGNKQNPDKALTATQHRTVSSHKNGATRNNLTASRKLEVPGVRESAGTAATVLTKETTGPVVLVPLDARALKISIDNGRGSSRTISLPTVSFGSQRLMARESFLAPPAKGIW